MSGRSNSPWANNGGARGVSEGGCVSTRPRGGANGQGGSAPTRTRCGAGANARPCGGGTRWAGTAALALLALAAAVGAWWMARDCGAEGAPVREARSDDGKRKKATSPRRTEKAAAKAGKKTVVVSVAGVKRTPEGDVAEVERPAEPAPAATNAAAAGARPKRIFNNGLEQMAGWIFTRRLGDTPPPLPNLEGTMTAERLEEILSTPNPALEGDSEREADIKRTVAEAKRALAEYLKAGGDVQGFFEHYRGLLVEAHKTWQTNQKAMMKAFRENPEEAPALVRRLNEEMAEHGIKPLTVPPMYRELMDAEEE